MIQQQAKGGGLVGTAIDMVKAGPSTFFRGAGRPARATAACGATHAALCIAAPPCLRAAVPPRRLHRSSAPRTPRAGTGAMMAREGIYAGSFLGIMPVFRESIRKMFPDSLGAAAPVQSRLHRRTPWRPGARALGSLGPRRGLWTLRGRCHPWAALVPALALGEGPRAAPTARRVAARGRQD